MEETVAAKGYRVGMGGILRKNHVIKKVVFLPQWRIIWFENMHQMYCPPEKYPEGFDPKYTLSFLFPSSETDSRLLAWKRRGRRR